MVIISQFHGTEYRTFLKNRDELDIIRGLARKGCATAQRRLRRIHNAICGTSGCECRYAYTKETY